MGRANENGIGGRNLDCEDFVINQIDKVCYIEESQFYVNVNGDYLPGCDYSYEDQESFIIGNVRDDIEETIYEHYDLPKRNKAV